VKRTLKRESKELEIVKREAKSTRWSLGGGRMGKTVYLLSRRPYSDSEQSEDEFREEDERLNSRDRPWATKRSSGSWIAITSNDGLSIANFIFFYIFFYNKGICRFFKYPLNLQKTIFRLAAIYSFFLFCKKSLIGSLFYITFCLVLSLGILSVVNV
jgi:hypothetical protein